MLQSDVETLVSFIDPPPRTVREWKTTLEPLDARKATNAVLNIRKTSDVVHLDNFRQAYGLADRAAMPIDIPEWVQVWWWCRRTSAADRGFPQQDGESDRPQMSLVEYRDLLAQWVKAGRPAPKTVAALVGS